MRHTLGQVMMGRDLTHPFVGGFCSTMSISEASEAGQAQAGAPDRIPFVAATETIEVGPPLRVKPTYAWLEWDSGQHL